VALLGPDEVIPDEDEPDTAAEKSTPATATETKKPLYLAKVLYAFQGKTELGTSYSLHMH
jgi:hypothetical protein